MEAGGTLATLGVRPLKANPEGVFENPRMGWGAKTTTQGKSQRLCANMYIM